MNPVVSPLPAVAVGALGALVLLLAMLLSLRSAFYVMGAMLFFASISVIVDWDRTVYRTWLLPLQVHRAPLYAAFGIVLLAGFLPRLRMLSLWSVSGVAWVSLLLVCYIGLARMYHYSVVDGATTIGVAVLATLPLAVALPALLRRPEDVGTLLRTIVWAIVVWVGAVAVQFALNRDLVVLGTLSRFTGLIGNSNQAATLMAATAGCALWLTLHGTRHGRLVYGSLTALFLLLLLWTASRGGMLMFAIMASAILYSRFGRTALLLPVLGVLFVGVLQLAALLQIDLTPERLISTENTRGAVWGRLWTRALSSPWIGNGVDDLAASENSYLLVWAGYGIIGPLLMLTLLAVAMFQVVRLVRLRRRCAPELVPYVDLVVGHQAMYFLGGVLEGYIAARVSSHTMFLLMFAAVGKYLLDLDRSMQRAAQHEAWDDGIVDGPSAEEAEGSAAASHDGAEPSRAS